MVNKKGYIRTLEAIIAMILIFIFILSILPPKGNEQKTPDDIDITARNVLNEIQNNNLYRDYVINMILTEPDSGKDSRDDSNSYDNIKNFINPTVPIAIGYELMICDIGQTTVPCYKKQEDLNLPKTNIYTKNILIENNRLVKLFLWRKA